MADYRVRDRRAKTTFWIDDAVVDLYGPAMRPFPFGSTAMAAYMVLCRRANDGEAWPGRGSLADHAATSESTVIRAVRLLELMGLIDVALCFDVETGRQTSNLYTLLTPPAAPPEIDRDWRAWPPPDRARLLVSLKGRRTVVSDDRDQNDRSRGFQPDTGEGITVTPSPCHRDTLPPVTVTPLLNDPISKDSQRREDPNETQPVPMFERAERAMLAAAAADPRRPPQLDLATWIHVAGYRAEATPARWAARFDPDQENRESSHADQVPPAPL